MSASETTRTAFGSSEIEPIRRAFEERKKRNSGYSLRAFARDIELSPAYVSLLLNGRRPVTLELIHFLSTRLRLSDTDTRRWTRSLGQIDSNAESHSEDFRRLSLDRFRAISDWWCLAILDLTLMENFREDAAWISQRLRIKQRDAKQALERCERLGLLKRDSTGRLRKTDARLTVETVQSDPSVRAYHRGLIHRALEELDHPERFEQRDISGISMTANPTRIQEAKKRIAAFQRQLLRFLSDDSDGPLTELYQFNTQLFPLTERNDHENP